MEHPYVANLAALGDAMIALPRGTSIAQRVSRDYPDLRIATVDSEREAFEMVEDGTALLTLRSLTMAAYTIRKEGWFNLKVSGEVPAYQNELRIGILREYPDLRDTLNAAVATIEPREVNDAVNRHIAIEVAYEIDRRLILQIVFGFLAAVLLVLVWVWRERRYGLALRREIESRTLTESELRESELRYRSLVDTAREGIAVVQDRRIAFANPRLAEMLGYTEADLSALLSFAPLIADEDLENALENYERRIAGEAADPRYEIRFKRSDGTVFPAELSATKITWKNQPATLNVIQEVANRLRTSLRQSDLVSRIGGDEFIVGLPLVESHKCATEVAEKLVKTLSTPSVSD
jgi:PAS domain S-box-containing protein